MQITIQRIVDFDAAFIQALFEAANEKSVSPNPEFLKDNRNVLLVAYTEGQACGMLYAYMLTSPHKPHPEMFLYSVDTFEPFRKRGVAVQLIEQLKRVAKEHGCVEMFVMTNNNNKAAMGLYEKTGGVVGNYDDILFVYELSDQ
ncbi:MAG: GNAT family N-acetyltransferase [Flammeovirgaceae bacterium]